MNKFYVGQRVLIISEYSENRGAEATIIRIEGPQEWLDVRTRGPVYGLGYFVDLEPFQSYAESALKPIYDGDQASDMSYEELMDSLNKEELVV